MKCSNCGQDYDDSFLYCPHCAEKNPSHVAEKPPEPSPTDAPLVAEPPDQPGQPLSTLTPSIPIPPDMPLPPVDKPWLWRRKSTWIILAAALVVIAVALTTTIVLLSGSPKRTSVAGNPNDVATAFMQEGLNGNYDKAFEMVAKSDYPLLGVMICQYQKQAALSMTLKTDKASLRDYYSTQGFLNGFFGAEGVKSITATGEVQSATETQLKNNVDMVSIQYKGAEKPFPLMVIQEDGGWFVDLSTPLVMGKPATAKYISDTVEALLANPTESNCTKAIDLLQASKGLVDKYDLWLQPASKSVLTSDKVKELEDAKAIASNLDSLSAKAETALTAARAAPKPPAPVPATPTWQTIIDVTGSTDKQTQTFYLGSGQKKLLYNIVGDSWSMCAIYLMQSGHSLSQEGGFPIVSPDGPGPGDTYINEPAGSYYLDISSANCTYQVTVIEMK